MSHFLAAGELKEKVRSIAEAATYLRYLRSLDERQREKLLAELAQHGLETTYEGEFDRALSLIGQYGDEVLALIDGLSCEPLIYTDSGSTDEVIRLLDRLVDARERRRQRRRKKPANGAGTATTNKIFDLIQG